MDANQQEQELSPRHMRALMIKNIRDAFRKRAMHIQKHNLVVKREARRAVRRPGKDYTALFKILHRLIGNVEDRKEVLRDVIFEAMRFKRRELAQLLEDFMVEMEINEDQDGNPVCQQCALVHDRYPNNCTCQRGRKIG